MDTNNSSPFLDDLLYEHTMSFIVKTPEDFILLCDQLYVITQDKLKPFIFAGQSKKNALVAIDRAFNSWNLFISRLKKKKYPYADFLEEYHFKKIFFLTPELKAFYH